MTATLTETRTPHAGTAHGPGATASTPFSSSPMAPSPMTERVERGVRGGGGGRGGAMTIDPRDRAQLADAPVPISRVLALFRPHRGRVAVVVAIIVIAVFVALGPQIKNMFTNAVDSSATDDAKAGLSAMMYGGSN